jgi:D-arabinose 1-dehydrogenase-like Zn-dependent alcohol dehydrogenase
VWEPVPPPTPGDGDVLVRVEACGVGLTVLNCIRGDLADDAATLPRVPGHELVGRVVDVGPGADRDLIGRRVVAYFYLSCGRCPACATGAESRCSDLAGWVGVHRDGGYAPSAALPSFNAIPVPDDLDPVAATVVPDAVATALHVCRARAGIVAGERVAVIGAAGGVGVHVAQVARLLGGSVAALDVTADKLAALERLGFDAIDSGDFVALAASWAGPAPEVVIDLVGSEASLGWACDALAIGGRLAVLTTFRDRIGALDPRRLVLGEATIVGSKYASRAEVVEAATLVAGGSVEPVIGRTVDPAGIPDVHEDLRAGRLFGRGALRWAGAGTSGGRSI